MQIIIIGRGKMGTLIEKTAAEDGMEVLGLYDIDNKDEVPAACDMVLDFSHRDNLSWVLDYCKKTGAGLVYGTTGLTEEHRQELNDASKEIPIFYGSNFSLGVAILRKAVSMITPALKDDFDIEIMEMHHGQKADAPSGTAKMLVEAIDPEGEFERVYGREGMTGKRGKEIGIHALRGGTVAGEHEVLYLGKDEELRFTHKAISRQIFVNGAIKACRFLADKAPGLYGMDDMIG